MGERARTSRARLGAAAVLVALYALPLFWPPGPVLPVPAPDDGAMDRLFPGVPALWVGVRLVALAMAAALLSGATPPLLVDPLRAAADHEPDELAGARRGLALVIAILQATVAPWASRLGPLGQTTYLALLFVPALLLMRPPKRWRPATGRGAALVAGLIGSWIVMAFATDLGSPRAADAVDGWRGIVGLARFSAQRQNVLTDLWDPDLPGLGALPLVFMAEPLFQAGTLPPSLRTAQVFQILWLALTAAGIGVVARALVGSGVAAVAVAFFLFAPYTRFMAVLPGPFLAGPLYATALLLALLAACRRSEAGLAALGTLAGASLTFPGVIPVAAVLVAATAWSLRRDWRRCWLGAAAGLAGFTAIVVPALPRVLTPNRMPQHLGAHGSATLLETALLGQAPIAAFETARATMASRPLEIIAGALVEPFANPRTPIRLWGDSIFDPLGAALLAVGLVAALRTARGSAGARFLLLLFAAALAPAFVSPVDRVDIVHAVALPVPAALLAALGFAAVREQAAVRRRPIVAAAAAVAIAVGGTALFDVVNPRILAASSTGIMFRVLRADEARRVVVLDYPPDYAIDVRWLFTGVITAYGGPAPVGYLPYGGGALPADELAAEGRNLLFWSPGMNVDLRVAEAVCRRWPTATFYEIADEAGLGHTQAAVVGEAPWTPAAPATRWRRSSCPAIGSRIPRPTRPDGSRGTA